MQVKNLQTQKGFTLVEIAIVLVIIGLLLGGVLKGQELIENAKIKSVTQDFDNISAAYYAYQDRVGNIPGDAAAAGGATDGEIANDDAFWFDLKTQNFIDGAPGAIGNSDGPTHDLAGVWAARPGDVAANAMFTVNHICATGVEESYALGMDVKMDDGNSATGKVRAGLDAADGTSATTVIAEATNYSAASTALVTICKEL